MSYSLDELTTPLTVAEIKTSIYETLAAVGINTTSWKTGAVPRVLITAFAILFAAMSVLVSNVAKMGFLARATGSWLRLVASYVYNTDYNEATFATGYVTLTNAGAGLYEFDDPGDLVVSAANGKEYRSTEGSLTLNPLSTLVVAIQAVEAGSASTAQAGTITEIVSPELDDVTCTNAAAVIGNDEESDPELRIRARAQAAARSAQGPEDAYTVAALEATRADGTLVGVTRVRSWAGANASTSTYVAGASGAIPGTSSDPGTDLGAVNVWVQRRANSLGVTSDVYTATPVTVDVVATLTLFNTGLPATDPEAEAACAAKLTTYFRTIPIGGVLVGAAPGKVWIDTLSHVIKSAYLAQAISCSISTPATDISIDPDEVPTFGTLTLTVVRVPVQGGYDADVS